MLWRADTPGMLGRCKTHIGVDISAVEGADI